VLIERVHIDNSHEEHVMDYAMILKGYFYRIANGTGVSYAKTWREALAICTQYKLPPKKFIQEMSEPPFESSSVPQRAAKKTGEPEYVILTSSLDTVASAKE